MGEGPAVGWHRRASGVAQTVMSSVQVSRWQLWTLPHRVLALVIAVDLAAIGSTVGTAWMFSVQPHHWVVAAVLVVLGRGPPRTLAQH